LALLTLALSPKEGIRLAQSRQEIAVGTTRPARSTRVAALLATAALLVLVPAATSHASGVTVSDLANGVTADGLAQALGGGGVAISNVTYTGNNRAAGAFNGGGDNIGLDTGVVLSSGNVQTYSGDPPCSRGVEGPNNCFESGGPDGGENSTGFGGPGDADLDALSGFTTEDAAVLEFDFVPQQSTLSFSYVFGSEEYSDFSNTGFNDVFAFLVNNTNCAVVPGTTDPVTINTINNGNDVGGDATPHHPELFRDNVRPAPSIDSQMDGLTTVLTCQASVNPGVTNHAKLAIADAGDDAFDAAVFLLGGSLVSGPTLNVAKNGTGRGTVTSSPGGITCGFVCSRGFTSGTSVTLTATPAAGSVFTGWSGDCTGTGGCTVTMDQARSVTATFDVAPTTPPPPPPPPPPPVLGGPGTIASGDLFCGVQHRGKCKGLKVKGTFDRPGNAVWTFAAYNPSPGHSRATAAAGKKLRLGQIKRVIKKAGTVTVVFKLKKGARTNKLYRQVKKRKLKNILVTVTFTTPSGQSVNRRSIKLKR
jgi:hypothetical protein